jgi:hypothetical protein
MAGIVYGDDDYSLLPNNYKGVDTKNNNSQFVIDYPRPYNTVNHQSYNDDGFLSLVIDVKRKGLSTCIYMDKTFIWKETSSYRILFIKN